MKKVNYLKPEMKVYKVKVNSLLDNTSDPSGSTDPWSKGAKKQFEDSWD